ncbi:MAG: tetratricopeptide repeat protein [Acidobacteriota bacterium]|nr:MAG: tetratricopeptide repeat protein [Acidobacteriota bacterium]
MGKKSRSKKSRTAPKGPGAAPRPVGEEALAESWAIPLWVALVVLVVLPSILYFSSLTNPFLYDDVHSLVDNPHVRGLQNIPSFFTTTTTTSVFSDKGHYRPVLFSTYALSYALGGYDYDPGMFRVFNLVFHVLNSLLVFAVFRSILRSSTATEDGRIFGKTAAAFFAALLFAVHPLNTESVNYISCRSNVLATTFYLAGVGLFVGYAGSAMMRRRTALYAGSLLCFVLGLLTKEIVITLPVILMLLDILILSPDAKVFDLKTLFRRHVMFWVIAGAHLFLIFAVSLKPAYERRGVLSNLLIQTKAVVFYLRLLVFPRGLSVSHGFEWQGTANAAFFLSLAVLGILVFAAWRMRERMAHMSFGVSWYFITLLPTSSFLPLNIPVNEHRAYLPAVGFAAAVAFLLELARGMSVPIQSKSVEARTRLRPAPTLGRLGQALSKLAVPLFVVVVGIFSVAVYARNQVWKTPVALWEDAVKKYPNNVHAHETLGLEYEKIGDLEKAEQEFLFAVRHGGTDETLAKSHNGLGIIYAKRKEYESAIEHFTLSVELTPSAWHPNHNLGIAYVAQGHNEKALKYLQKAVELNPHDEQPYRYLAKVYLALGKIDEAGGVLQEMKKLGFSVPEDLRERLETAMENP